MRISQIMTHPVETATLEEPAETVWERMKLKKIHHLIVKDGARIVGVLSARDVEGGVPFRERLTARELMTPFAVKVRETATVRHAANLMRGWTVGCLPIVDVKDRLVGIVTISDLLVFIGRGALKPVAKPRRWTLHQRAPTRSPHVPPPARGATS